MKKEQHRPVYNNLKEQYEAFGLDADGITDMEFTILSLKAKAESCFRSKSKP